MTQNGKELVVIVGPTSSGKTSLALDLAKKRNGTIVSADSRQIYKHMDVGTGKLPINSEKNIQKGDEKWKIDGIDVWGYDLADPNANFTTYNYASFAINKINELASNSENPIYLVGGTGLYIDVVLGKIVLDYIKPNPKLRKKLEGETKEELANTLTSLNPKVAGKTDKNNKVRLIRAIEKCMSKGKERDDPLPKLVSLRKKVYGLLSPNQILYKRADKWLDFVWENGLLDETKDLLSGPFKGSNKLKGLVYKSAVAYLTNAQSESIAKERAKFDLHAYIRRQLTWFKRDNEIKWLETDKIQEHTL